MYMYTSLKIQNMIKLYEEEKERNKKDMKEKIKNKKIVISMLVVLVLVLFLQIFQRNLRIISALMLSSSSSARNVI